jgi:hypothetical protein
MVHGGDLGIIKFGKGQYEIRNDSLFLDYNLTPLQFNSYHRTKYYENNKDLIELKITVFDMDGKPLLGILLDSELSNHPVKTNRDGLGILKIKNDKKKNLVMISDEKYGVYSFELWNHLNYDIEVFLEQDLRNITPIKGTIFKYQILEYTDQVITLQNKNKVLKLKKSS